MWSIVSLFNLINAMVFVISMPSYYMLLYCPQCPKFLKSAGELVQHLWYPNRHMIRHTVKDVGERGQARYEDAKEVVGEKVNRVADRLAVFRDPLEVGDVFKPPCVPCPGDLSAEFLSDDVSHNPRMLMDPTNNSTSLNPRVRQCVLIDGFDTGAGRVQLLGRDPVSPRDFVCTMLFGGKWRDVWTKLYGWNPDGEPTQRKPITWYTATQRLGKDNWNRSFFKGSETPFTWMRYEPLKVWYSPSASATQPDRQKRPTAEAYYTINGMLFIPPKLWDYQWTVVQTKDGKYYPKEPSRYASPTADFKDVDKRFSVTTQPHPYAKQDALSFVTATKRQRAQAENPDGVWYYSDRMYENEIWYPTCTGDACRDGDRWLNTSLQYWTDDNFRDYIAQYFQGFSGWDVKFTPAVQ